MENKITNCRELCFFLIVYSHTTMKNTINNVKNKNVSHKEINLIGSYFAGLIEGDGSIILRKEKFEKLSPAIIFTFHKKERPLYEKLKTVLNSGNIFIEKRGVCRYQITNVNAIINMVNLVNGCFRTPKIKVLYQAIDNLNK